MAAVVYLLLASVCLSQITSVVKAQCTSSSSQTALVALSDDDASETLPPSVTTTGALTFANQYIGVRFASVYIPKSATITSAYIQFTTYSSSSGISNVGIRGHNVAKSNSFTNASGSTDISTRYTSAPTSASVNWASSSSWIVNAHGATQQTPDLTAIVQEIVNRSDWKPNNPITILFDAHSSGTGPVAQSKGTGGQSPQLIITFQAATSVSVVPTVSGCYSTTAGSKATVSVNVNWTDAPANDSLIVVLGSQRQSIMPGTNTINFYDLDLVPTPVTLDIVSPQVFAFEVPANAATGTVTSFFKSNSACTGTASYTAPAACTQLTCTPGTDLSGTAFNDFNADGIKNPGETSGVPGVIVNAYDCAGTTYTATTDANGQYKLTIPSGNYPVRVEFTNLPAAYLAQGTPNGSDGRTTVQFVTSPDCGVDLGMLNPTEYCQNNPKIFVPCYVSGDPLTATAVAGNAGGMDAFVSINSSDYSTVTGYNTHANTNNPTHIANAAQVGSLWGTVYNKKTKTIFTSAVLRRHSGLGTLGLGGIYAIDQTNTVTPFLDVATTGIDVGSALVGSNSSRGLFSSATAGSYDPVGFSQTGKVGIGGLALSSDGNQLYFVNLFDKKVYSLDLTTYNSGGASPTTSLSFAIPNGCSVGSNSRPWGIKYHKGKVYVGVICDGAISDNRSDLQAFVYSLDPSNSAWTTVVNFPLTYTKGPANLNDTPDRGTTSSNWRTWTDTFGETVYTEGGQSYLHRSQPILSSIEFDVDNSLILAFADRMSFQGGANNFGVTVGDPTLYYAVSGGDILRVGNLNSVYTLENSAKVGSITGSFPDNNEGPGIGEFYDDNFFVNSILYNGETALGGLALRPGSGSVVITSLNPLNNLQSNNLNFYGFRQLSNKTGAVQSSYIVYEDNTIQKSVSLGDIELGCFEPTFIEIGNRVWFDTNNDGIQGPCEPAMPGVNVSLYKSGVLLATTTTNIVGEYYFSSKSRIGSGTWSGAGADTTLLPNTAYQIVFGAGQFTNNGLNFGVARYQIAPAFSSAPTASTLNDSNVQLLTVASNTLPTANVTTGAAGSVNHTIDAGFICLPTLVANVSPTPAICSGLTVVPNTARIDLTGVQNGDKAYLYTTGPAPSYTAVGGQPVSSSAVSFTGLADPATVAGQSYSIIVYNGPNCSTIVTTTLPQAVCGPCALSITATPGICQEVGNTYTVTGTISLTSAVVGVMTITDGVASTTLAVSLGQISLPYALVGLLSGTGTHTVTVSLPGCSTVSTTYAAPSSCSTTACGLAMTVTPGLCQSATNSYVLSGTITASNVPAIGTLTISSGAFSPQSLTLPVGNASGTFSYSNLVSNGQAYTVTASYSNSACSPISQTFTAPASCSVAPVCALSATATASTCATATNTYTATVVATLTNGTAGTLTVNLPGSSPVSQTIVANTPSVTVIFPGLISDGAIHTATISLPGCGTTTANFTAPASCSVAPVCSISAVATAGICQTATNTYSSTVVVTVNNPTAGTLVVADGEQTLSFSTTVNSQNTFIATFSGQISNGSTHSVTATLINCGTTSTTYTAPASCSVAPVCSISAVATAGICQTATNTYSSTVVVTVNNPPSGTITIGAGNQTQTFSTTASAQNTFTIVFPGLISDGASHTVTASLPGCSTSTTTYTAPASCSAAPLCDLSVIASGSNCDPATNLYVLSGTITLTNSPASQTLTLTDGSYVHSLTASSGNSSIAFSYTTLQSDGATHTVTVVGSTTACSITSTTYTAPASCSVEPVCSLTAVATPGLCASATNTFSNTVVVTMTNPTAGTLTVSDGVQTMTFDVPASVGTTTAIAIFDNLISDSQSHTITASLSSCSTTSTTYTAPASCTTAPLCSLSALVTAGDCSTATNTYSAAVVLSLTNVSGGTLTVSIPGASPVSQTLAANTTSLTMVIPGLISDGASHTATVSLPGCATITSTFTAPASCSTASPINLVVSVTPGACLSATNQYSISGALSLTNALAGTATITDGATSTTVTVPLGATSVAYSLTGLASGTGSHTVSVSYLTQSASVTYTAPASCTTAPLCSLSALVTAGDCSTATNTYSAAVVLSLTNVSGGTLTVSIPGASPVSQTLAANTTSLTMVIPGLISDGASHTATVSLPGCATITSTFTAPASCSTASPINLVVSVTPGACLSATNQYSLSGTLSLTNALAGIATITDGLISTTVSVGQSDISVPYSMSGLTSGTGSHTVSVSYLTQSASVTYTAPASCTTAPLCSLSALVTAGDCSTATNTYSAAVVLSLTNVSGGTLTVSIPGASPVSQTLAANTTSLTMVIPGLISDGASHTATVSLPGCATITSTFTAPASCSTASPINLVVSVTPGACLSATNQYSISGTLSLTNALAGTATITDGATSTTVTVPLGATSVAYSLTGLASGTGSHTVSVSYLTQSASVTYTAPASCTTAPLCSLSALVTAGDCSTATNTYSAAVVLSLTNVSGGTLTVSIPGASPVSQTLAANTTSLTIVVPGLISDGASHTATVSLPGCSTITSTFTAPASCSVAPTSLALAVTPGTCLSATNQYSISGTLSLTNAVAGTATLTDGAISTTVTVPSGATSVAYSLTGLTSGTGSHTVTVSYVDKTASMTYASPASCSLAIALDVVEPGPCDTQAGLFNISGVLSLTNAVNGVATISDGAISTTIAITSANTQVPYSLTAIPAGPQSHTVTVSFAGETAFATYSAPIGCIVSDICSPVFASVTPGTCASATNTYSTTAVVVLNNPVAGTLVVTTQGQSQTFITTAVASATFTASFTNLPSDGAIHSLTATLPGCPPASTTYAAPASCTVGLAMSVTPGVCQSATNQYSISGTLSLTNALAGIATITDGATSTTVTVPSGATSVAYSLTGLTSGTNSHTVSVNYVGKTASATYTAPASCTTAPVCSLSALVTAGDCSTATNTYSAAVVLSLTNVSGGTLTVSIPGASPVSQTVAANTTSLTMVVPGLISDGASHTATVSLPGCSTITSIFTAPASCSVAQINLALAVTPGACLSATNQYSISGTLSLTNAQAGIATLTDGVISTTVSVSANDTSVPYSMSGLTSGTGSHTLTVSYLSQSTSVTYTAPASCTVALALTVTPGSCQSATNQYSISGALSLTNALAGTATITDGATSTTVTVPLGATSVAYSLTGLASGTGSHTVSVSYLTQSASVTYTAPASCTTAPLCSLSALVTAGDCSTATNTYSAAVVLSLTNVSGGTLTVSIPGASPVSQTLAANTTSLTMVVPGLISDGASHTATVSLPGCATITSTFTAPASCSTASPINLAVSVTPGACLSATNQYSLSGTLSLTNALAGIATISDGATSTTVTVPLGATSVAYSLTGLASGTGSHTVSVSYLTQSASVTYTAPASCTTAPLCSLSALVTAGDCSTATNTYSAAVVLSLTNVSGGTLTVSIPGASPVSQTLAANTTSLTMVVPGLISDGASHTATVSLPGCSTTTSTYVAPVSCSIVMSLTVVDPGVCNPNTNTYSNAGIIYLTNAPEGIATITDGAQSMTIAISAGATSVPYSLSGLPTGTGQHTVTVTFAGATAQTTYMAPASCTCPPIKCVPIQIKRVR